MAANRIFLVHLTNNCTRIKLLDKTRLIVAARRQYSSSINKKSLTFKLKTAGPTVWSQIHLRCISSSLKSDDSVLSFQPSSLSNMSQQVAMESPSQAEVILKAAAEKSATDLKEIDLSGFVVPDAPTPIGTTAESLSNLDLTLSQLELASNWLPPGWIMHYLDLLHTTLPWWGSIAIATLTFRILMFPLVIKAQKNAIKMNALVPEMQEIQLRMNNARLSGNQLEVAKCYYEMQNLYKKHDVKPVKSMLVPLAQAPIFVSIFILLRRMANLPVESLKTGGIFWFTDLTVPDPFYILPVITCASLWAALEFGVESGVAPGSTINMKLVFRVMPLIMFPFIFNFPSAILTYWCTSNIISLVQVVILKQEPVRKFFKIPKKIKHDPKNLPMKPKGWIQGFKDSMHTAKVQRQIAEREKIDEINFRKASIGPIKKTYKYDPTKVRSKS